MEDPPGCAARGRPAVVTTASLTKVFGLGPLRIGWAIGREDLIERAIRIHDNLGVVHPFLTESIGAGILADAKRLRRWKERIHSRAETNRSMLADFYRRHPEFDGGFPDAGILTFPRWTGNARFPDAETLCRRAEAEGKVVFVPGRFYQRPHHLRIAVGGTGRRDPSRHRSVRPLSLGGLDDRLRRTLARRNRPIRHYPESRHMGFDRGSPARERWPRMRRLRIPDLTGSFLLPRRATALRRLWPSPRGLWRRLEKTGNRIADDPRNRAMSRSELAPLLERKIAIRHSSRWLRAVSAVLSREGSPRSRRRSPGARNPSGRTIRSRSGTCCRDHGEWRRRGESSAQGHGRRPVGPRSTHAPGARLRRFVGTARNARHPGASPARVQRTGRSCRRLRHRLLQDRTSLCDDWLWSRSGTSRAATRRRSTNRGRPACRATRTATEPTPGRPSEVLLPAR